MRVRRIVGEKFWCSMRICRGMSDFFGRMLWARDLKCQDNRISGHLFAGKMCLHLSKEDLDALLSVFLTGNGVRQTRKEGSTAYL